MGVKEMPPGPFASLSRLLPRRVYCFTRRRRFHKAPEVGQLRADSQCLFPEGLANLTVMTAQFDYRYFPILKDLKYLF